MVSRMTRVVGLLALGVVVLAGCGSNSKTSNQNSSVGWLANYDQAAEQAKKEEKVLLMNFTGSDWCPWCQKLDKEVFSTSAFEEFSGKNLVLLKVDFPRRASYPPTSRSRILPWLRNMGSRDFQR